MDSNGMIEVDGFEFAYRIEGEGVPVLVVGSAVYYPQLFSEELRKKLKLIFIDHRGHVKPPRALKSKDFTLDRILEGHKRNTSFRGFYYTRAFRQCVNRISHSLQMI